MAKRPIDNPDPIYIIVRDAMGLRRVRLDQPAKDCYTFAKANATNEVWDWLMRQKPDKGAA